MFKGYWVSFWGVETVQKLTVVMAAQLWEQAKPTELQVLKVTCVVHELYLNNNATKNL